MTIRMWQGIWIKSRKGRKFVLRPKNQNDDVCSKNTCHISKFCLMDQKKKISENIITTYHQHNRFRIDGYYYNDWMMVVVVVVLVIATGPLNLYQKYFFFGNFFAAKRKHLSCWIMSAKKCVWILMMIVDKIKKKICFPWFYSKLMLVDNSFSITVWLYVHTFVQCSRSACERERMKGNIFFFAVSIPIKIKLFLLGNSFNHGSLHGFLFSLFFCWKFSFSCFCYAYEFQFFTFNFESKQQPRNNTVDITFKTKAATRKEKNI